MGLGSYYWPDWGTLAVAIVALVQPWISAAYRKWFRSPFVSIFPAGRIEIGYSHFGPTIGLHGSLKTDHEDAFVSEIELDLVRERDQATHQFSWNFFREKRGRLTEPHDFEVELAASFLLSMSQPYRYNILFSDSEVQQTVRTATETLQAEWFEFATSQFDNLEEMEQRTALDLLNRNKRVLYEQFQETDEHLDAWRIVNRARYWEAGAYSLTMRVLTADPSKAFERQWRFTLDDSQANMLSLNVPRILQSTCSQDATYVGNFSFAYVEYEEIGARRIEGV